MIIVSNPPLTPREFFAELALLIGTPWSPERPCWWWVQWVFARREGIAMPWIDVGAVEATPEGVRQIKHAANASGLRRVEGTPLDRDVVLMENRFGERHVGVMVPNGSTIGLLHCEGSIENPQPGLQWEPLDAVAMRYKNFEAWRRVA